MFRVPVLRLHFNKIIAAKQRLLIRPSGRGPARSGDHAFFYKTIFGDFKQMHLGASVSAGFGIVIVGLEGLAQIAGRFIQQT